MGSLISSLIYPFDTLRSRQKDNDDGNIDDLLYHLTLFFAFGIWTVFRRYQNARNRAIPFYHKPLEAVDPKYDSVKIPNASLESHKYMADLLPAREEEPGRDYITCFDPATGLHLDTIMADSAADIRLKIERAAHAQKSWRSTTFADRRRVVRSLKKWLVENQEVCARTACRDTGKTLIDASLGEILTTCSKMDWLIQHGETYLRPETRKANLMLCYKKSQVHYEPLGVVAAIVSWNYPLHNAWSPILAALFAGNAIVLKCSEQVLWSTRWFVGVIHACLRACDFDEDLVQLACCWPSEADALTRSATIKHITFIGSEPVGRSIAMAATENLTPVTLELGGKDPAIVLPGTDIEKWLSTWMRGIYQNAGQNCIGIERLIVHESQYDELYSLMTERVGGLRLGSALTADGVGTGVDCGSMISTQRFQALEDVIQAAGRQGAVVEYGGGRMRHPYLDQGAYFTPTVVGNANSEMEIAKRELFAPVALLMKYEEIEEAIDIANGTRYGLGASVFGPDQDQCLEVAKALECGMVSVNDFGVFYLNQDLPFGGFKASGYGRFGGPEGIRSLTNPKVIVVDRWPWLVQTSIPKALDYPIRSLSHGWACKNFGSQDDPQRYPPDLTGETLLDRLGSAGMPTMMMDIMCSVYWILFVLFGLVFIMFAVSLLGAALAGLNVIGATSANNAAPVSPLDPAHLFKRLSTSCGTSGAISCLNTTAQNNFCCFESPGGLLLQPQFWDTNPSTGPSNSWTIHGLWPDNCDGTFSQNCDSSRAYTGISSLLTNQGASDTLTFMEEFWVDINGANEQFWEAWSHEWSTHGTCLSTLHTSCLPSGSAKGAEAVAFFQTVVKLFKTLPTYDWLAAEGITPSSSQTFTLSQLTTALKNQAGVIPAIDCSGSSINQISWYFHLKGSIIDGTFVAIGEILCTQAGIVCLQRTEISPQVRIAYQHQLPFIFVEHSYLLFIFVEHSYLRSLPTKATISVLTSSGAVGGLLSAGTWSVQTPGTYTLSGTSSSFTLTSSKGRCAVQSSEFVCGSSVSTASTFSAVSSGSNMLLVFDGSTAFTADATPSGTAQETVSTGSSGSEDVTLALVST
ncbi:hypothetical protein EW146_g285 [Bondarzewia mesenterica]|uniref:Ribonuclease T2-like n=1 Tax=Bondarzewia mesenterica TaxID=1095465 RepID=A0A4S4M7T1_9AGAM|nr:hypothetical protein EW146_g285 [Bondarzewia mesenterica]